MSVKSSQNKTPRSEDMVTIERLEKERKGLETKLKNTKKKFKEEKLELKIKIEECENEIEEKNTKLKSLKDTLVEKFKNDIVKIYGEGSISQKLGQKEKEIEARLLKAKDEEIIKIRKKLDQEYQNKLSKLQQQLSNEKQNRIQQLEDLKASQEYTQNLSIKYENDEKLGILKENRGTFTI